MENITTLTLTELLILKAKVDAVINEKQVVHIFESQSNQAKSLAEVIDLVDEWMADESDYDQETYSSIEQGLNRNQLSL